MANAKISVHDKDTSKMLTITPEGGNLDKDVEVLVPTEEANPVMATQKNITDLVTQIENGDVVSKDGSKVASKSYSMGDGNPTLNFGESIYHKVTVNAAGTIGFSGFENGKLGVMMVELTNGGAHSVAWPAALKWIAPDGSLVTSLAAMSVNLNTAGKDFVSVFSEDGGNTLYAKILR